MKFFAILLTLGLVAVTSAAPMPLPNDIKMLASSDDCELRLFRNAY